MRTQTRTLPNKRLHLTARGFGFASASAGGGCALRMHCGFALAAGRCMVGSRRAAGEPQAVIQTKRVLGEEAFILKAVPARTLALRSHSPSFVPPCRRWFSCRTDRALKRRDP